MDTIRINNDYSYFVSDDELLKSRLHQALRFRERNYFHSRLYKQKIWDGFIDFFNKDTGKFLTGLMPEVLLAMKHFGVKYKIEDMRNWPKWTVDSVDKDFLKQWIPKSGLWPNGEVAEPFDLYDYQIEYINLAIKHGRGLVVAPTSAGKTNIMVGILKALPPNCPTLVLANATTLSDQNYYEISKWGFKNVGRVYDKYFDPNVITCANVQAGAKLEPLLKHIKALVVDEVHVMMSKIPKAMYRKMKQAVVRIGISATPFKFGGNDGVQKYSVKGFFGPVFETEAADAEGGVLKTKTLQKRGTLSKSKATFYPIREPMIPYEIYQEAVTLGIAQSPYFHDVVARLTKTLTGRTLILVERLAHGDALAEMMPGAIWVRGEDNLKTRNWVKDQLKKAKGNVVAIATQGIFNTGINVFLHNLVNAAGGQADHQIIQRMGRGLRTAADKDMLNYYDFVFHINDYLLTHSRKRIKILTAEGHEVEVKEEIDF